MVVGPHRVTVPAQLAPPGHAPRLGWRGGELFVPQLRAAAAPGARAAAADVVLWRLDVGGAEAPPPRVAACALVLVRRCHAIFCDLPAFDGRGDAAVARKATHVVKEVVSMAFAARLYV